MDLYDSLAGQPNILGKSQARPQLKRKQETKHVDEGATDTCKEVI